MREKNLRNPKGGRPRSADRSALIAAQIRRVDALARRTHSQIWRLLSTHVSSDSVDRVWRNESVRIRGVLMGVYDNQSSARRVFDACSSSPPLPAIERELKALAHEALREIAFPNSSSMPFDWPDPPCLAKSRSLAAARARLADLQANLIDVRQSIDRGKDVLVARAIKRAAL
jgi:hypothetical protein